jgi:CubicO group peptidase (beta-lactamase class C family)
MAIDALDDLDDLVREAMKEWQVPGLALAIVPSGEPADVRGCGLRDVEAAKPVAPNTQFLLASTTKSFTAAGLGMLVDEVAWTGRSRFETSSLSSDFVTQPPPSW